MKLKVTMRMLAIVFALTLSTVWANSDYIAYQGGGFESGTAKALTNIALRFTILHNDGTTVVYHETQASVATTDKGFFYHQIGSGTRTGGAANYGAIAWAESSSRISSKSLPD